MIGEDRAKMRYDGFADQRRSGSVAPFNCSLCRFSIICCLIRDWLRRKSRRTLVILQGFLRELSRCETRNKSAKVPTESALWGSDSALI